MLHALILAEHGIKLAMLDLIVLLSHFRVKGHLVQEGVQALVVVRVTLYLVNRPNIIQVLVIYYSL